MTDARSQISFRFRGKTVSLCGFPPDRLLLDWLRDEAHAKGTKEGCAEGDCGACTVVVCRPRGGKLSYEPVNACILLLGQVDGAEVLTVEDLAEGETLHPTQAAFVDLHASQCGFCTPGFVMSLFAHYHDGRPADRQTLNETFAGNLCRCTGYRPILEAAELVLDRPRDDGFSYAAPARFAALEALPGGDVFVGDENSFFAIPASEESLAALYAAHPDATPLGGATDVGLWITKRFSRLPKIIWLGRVKGLDEITNGDRELKLGAGVRLSDAAVELAGIHSDLGVIMSRFGSVQVRASGTVGGSIANGSPIGDLAPALIALEGRVELRQDCATRELPLESFFIAYGKQDRRPGEFVRALYVPRLAPSQVFRAYKVSKRFDEDISAVMGAFRFDLDGGIIRAARIAFGGMAATPKRGATTEAALVGADLDRPETWEAAAIALAADYQPLSDMRASASYRLEVAAALVKRALTEISGAGAPTRLGDLVAAE